MLLIRFKACKVVAAVSDSFFSQRPLSLLYSGNFIVMQSFGFLIEVLLLRQDKPEPPLEGRLPDATKG